MPFVCSTSKINIEACVVEYWFIALEHQSSAYSTSSMTMWTWKYFNLIKFRFLPIIKVDESVTLFAPASRSLWTLMNWTWWRLLHRYLFIRVFSQKSIRPANKNFSLVRGNRFRVIFYSDCTPKIILGNLFEQSLILINLVINQPHVLNFILGVENAAWVISDLKFYFSLVGLEITVIILSVLWIFEKKRAWLNIVEGFSMSNT